MKVWLYLLAAGIFFLAAFALVGTVGALASLWIGWYVVSVIRAAW